MTDLSDAPPIAQAHRERFGTVRPASTLVQVAGLLFSARVNIEVPAVVADYGSACSQTDEGRMGALTVRMSRRFVGALDS